MRTVVELSCSLSLLLRKKEEPDKILDAPKNGDDYDDGSIQVGIESATKKAPCVRQLFGAVVVLRALLFPQSVYKVSVCKGDR